MNNICFWNNTNKILDVIVWCVSWMSYIVFIANFSYWSKSAFQWWETFKANFRHIYPKYEVPNQIKLIGYIIFSGGCNSLTWSTSTAGSFQSPHFPYTYYNSINCSYDIVFIESGTVLLTINIAGIDNRNGNCSNDYIEVSINTYN